MGDRKRIQGMLFLACAFLLAGTSVVAARFLCPKLGPFTVSAASILMALPALLAVYGRRMAACLRRMGAREWLLAGLQALFGVFLFRLCLVSGLRHTSASEAGILTGATPAATAVLARFLLKERVGRARALGVACTVAGVAALQGVVSGAGFSPAHLAGNLLVLLAALSESSFNVLSRLSMLAAECDGKEHDPAAQAGLVLVAALLLCLVPAAFERPAACLLSLDPTGWIALLWYGIFATAVAYICMYSGIRRCEAGLAAAFSGMMPLTALVLSVLLLGERPGAGQWAGGALVVAGMLLSCGRVAKHERKLPVPLAEGDVTTSHRSSAT